MNRGEAYLEAVCWELLLVVVVVVVVVVGLVGIRP